MSSLAGNLVNSEKNAPKWAWLILILNAAILVWAPFDNALYFDNAFMWSALLLSISTLITALVLRFNVHQIKGWLWTDKLVLAIAGSYILSSFSPANYEYALLGDVRALSIAAIYFAARLISSLRLGQALVWILTLTGAAVSVYALGNGFGTIVHNGGIFDESMRRLAGSFEYPNTMASFVSATALLSVITLSVSKNRWISSLQYLLGFLSLSTLILTQSRGAWVVAAGVFVLLWLFTHAEMRLLSVIRSLVMIAVTVADTPFLRKAVVAQSHSGWVWLAVGCAVVYLIGLAVESARERGLNRPLSLKILIPVVVVIAMLGAVALMILSHKSGKSGLLGRLSTINFQQFSVVQRLWFYRDGLKIFADHPILGDGYNTWMGLYEHYKSYPYNSRQAHSFLIDLLIDTGSVGVLVWIAFLVSYVRDFKRLFKSLEQQMKPYVVGVFMAGLTLLLHSFFDFDFSYAYMNFIFFVCVALTLPNLQIVEQQKSVFSSRRDKPEMYVHFAGIALGILGAVFAGGYLASDSALQKATASAKLPINDKADADAAASFAPYRATGQILSADFARKAYMQSHQNTPLPADISAKAESAVSLAPNDSNVLWTAAQIEANSGHLDQTDNLAKRAMDASRYRMEYTETYISMADAIGVHLYSQNPSAASDYFKKAVAAYQDANQRVAGLSQLPPVLHLEYPFAITDSMRVYVAESELYLKDYQAVHQVLAPVVAQKNPPQDKSDLIARAKMIDAAASVKSGAMKNYPELPAAGANAAALNQYYNGLKNLK